MFKRVVGGYKPHPYHGATLQGRTTKFDASVSKSVVRGPDFAEDARRNRHFSPVLQGSATLQGRTTCMNRTKTPCPFRTKVLIYAVLATRFVILSPDGIETKNLTPLRTGSPKNPETLRLGCAQAQGDIERRLVTVR